MRSYREHMHHLFAEVNEDVMDMLEKDKDYIELLNKLTKYQEKMEKIIFNYGDDIKKLFFEHRHTDIKMSMREKEELYYQGYRDCLALMACLSS